jgi:hypothetical protein
MTKSIHRTPLDLTLDVIELRAYAQKLEQENRVLSATLLTLWLKLARARMDSPDTLALVESAYPGKEGGL